MPKKPVKKGRRILLGVGQLHPTELYSVILTDKMGTAIDLNFKEAAWKKVRLIAEIIEGE